MYSPTSGLAVRFSAFRDAVRALVYVGVTSLWALAAGLFSPRALRPIRLSSRSGRRGAGMLEYALIAALAVGVFIFLRGFFAGLFERLTGQIDKKLENPISPSSIP